MKLDFGFYFRMVIVTGVLCALLYGLGEKTIQQHTMFALGMLSLVTVGIAGMIKHLSPATAEGQK